MLYDGLYFVALKCERIFAAINIVECGIGMLLNERDDIYHSVKISMNIRPEYKVLFKS